MTENLFLQINVHWLYALACLYGGWRWFSPAHTKTKRTLSLVLLSCLLVFSAGRLAGLLPIFADSLLQMDISCYYTAGESLNHGLSPYRNGILHDPPIWDGYAKYQHSRFLYPPIVARAFQLLALWDYRFVKALWMFGIIVCVLAGLRIVQRTLKIKDTPSFWLGLGVLLCLFHPFIKQLEYGQIDALSFILIVAAVSCLAGSRKKQFLAGALLSLATFIKLHSVLIVPFLILRRKGYVLQGYVLTAALILVLSLTANRALFFDYWFKELPRISWIGGETGPDDLKIPQATFDAYLAANHVFPGMTYKNGESYSVLYEYDIVDATLVRVVGKTVMAQKLYQVLDRFGLARQGKSVLAVLILGVFFVLMLLWGWRYPYPARAAPVSEWTYWQIVMLIILLCGMRTWSLNMIWLLPVALIVLHELSSPQIRRKGHQAALGLCLAGLGIIALPDQAFLILAAKGYGFFMHKYLIGQLMVFAGLLSCLTNMVKAERERENT